MQVTESARESPVHIQRHGTVQPGHDPQIDRHRAVTQIIRIALRQLHGILEQSVLLWLVAQPIDVPFLGYCEGHSLRGVGGVVADGVHTFEEVLQLWFDGPELAAAHLDVEHAQELAECGAQVQRVRLLVEAGVMRLDHRTRPQLE